MIVTEVQTGQRIRVTLLKDTWGWSGDYATDPTAQRIILDPAGTIYVGIVSDAEYGFFDLNLPNGNALGFYAGDSSLLIETIR